MPSPDSSAAPLATLTTQLDQFFQFVYDRGGFIAQQVYSTVTSMKATGQFSIRSLEEMLKNDDGVLERAPGTGYARDRSKFGTQTFATKERGYEEVVDDEEKAIYDEFDPRPNAFAAQRAVQRIAVQLEKRVAALVMDTTAYTIGNSNAVNPVATWDNVSTAKPITDVEAAAQQLFDNTGLWPNAVVMGRKAFRRARLTDQVLSAITSSGAGDQARARDVTAAQLAACFDVDSVMVGGQPKNTAAPGAAAAIAEIWGDTVMVARVAESEDMQEVCIGRVIQYTGSGATADGVVDTYREEQTRSDIVRVRQRTDENRIYTNAGVLINSVLP